jgi:hypothetical protein
MHNNSLVWCRDWLRIPLSELCNVDVHKAAFQGRIDDMWHVDGNILLVGAREMAWPPYFASRSLGFASVTP